MTTPVAFPPTDVRAIGMITDDTGKTSYFRSSPFTPPPGGKVAHRVEAVHIDRASGKITIPPRDYDRLLFGSRKVSIALSDGSRYNANKDVTLSHVSIRPLGAQPVWVRTRVYPEKLVDEVLAGRPEIASTSAAGEGVKVGAKENQIEWPIHQIGAARSERLLQS